MTDQITELEPSDVMSLEQAKSVWELRCYWRVAVYRENMCDEGGKWTSLVVEIFAKYF